MTIQAVFSSLLLGLGQAAAVLLFLLYRRADAFREKPGRIALVAAYVVLISALQYRLHAYLRMSGMGSLPTFPFLLAFWVLTILFLFLWERRRWEYCCFLAFVFLLIDSSVWPLISTLSRSLRAVNYLNEGPMGLRILFLLIFTLLECLLTLMVRRRMPDSGELRLNRYHAILALVIALMFLAFREQMGQSTDQVNKGMQAVMTLLCLGGTVSLACMVGSVSEEYEREQSEKMRQVLFSQQLLFEQKLKDADLINRKYHDMKNLLLYLRSEEGSARNTEAVDELLETIAPYGAQIQCGNEVVDVILSEKMALCQEEKISFIPCLDGALFDFVRPLDLCTLFGNALDNAIESCREMEDREKRRITLYGSEKGNAVVLTVRNSFAHEPDLRCGLPATTKADAASHGFGLRNMQMIAERYGGSLHCRVEGEEFVLTILLMRAEDR